MSRLPRGAIARMKRRSQKAPAKTTARDDHVFDSYPLRFDEPNPASPSALKSALAWGLGIGGVFAVFSWAFGGPRVVHVHDPSALPEAYGGGTRPMVQHDTMKSYEKAQTPLASSSSAAYRSTPLTFGPCAAPLKSLNDCMQAAGGGGGIAQCQRYMDAVSACQQENPGS
jgi:hypothetical protein